MEKDREMKKCETYQGRNHTFVICAYQESAYLEECILSVLKQTVKMLRKNYLR